MRPPRMAHIRRSTAGGSVGAKGHLRADDGRAGGGTRRENDRDDRRNIPQGPSNGDQHGRQKGGVVA